MIQGRMLAAGALIALAAPVANAASYFVQPIVIVSPGAFINGLEIDGDTRRTEGYFNSPTSVFNDVDLEEGTIRSGINLLGGGPPNGGSSQGRFGEQVTFVNGDGTTANLTFDFEGYITGPARDPNLNSFLQISVDGYIAVFDPSVGATASTWFDLAFGNQAGQALGTDRITLDFSNPDEEVDEVIFESLGVSVDVGPGQRSFDVFANLTISLATNNNVGPYSMQFDNTARFGVDAAPGVTYTSLSGVFLESTGQTAVPAPAALPLLGTAFAMGAGFLRRRRSMVSA